MKTVVSVQEIAELEIKPDAEVAEWRRLVQSEIETRWRDRGRWISVACPACDGDGSKPAFERHGIEYVECGQCGSLYAPRRPDEAALRTWYRDSLSADFWRKRLLTASAAARFEKIVRPRADWVLDGMAEYSPNARTLVDLSLHGRPLLETLVQESVGLQRVTAAGITADLDGYVSSQISVQPAAVAELARLGPVDVALAIDVFDRASDPRSLVETLGRMLAPGGVLFMTAAVCGFEVQTLWERSPSVLPPDKLTLPSVRGLMRRFPAPQWEILELSTPGMFDVETVSRTIAAEPDASWPRAIRSLVDEGDAGGREMLVELLQARRLTSFARLVARRRP